MPRTRTLLAALFASLVLVGCGFSPSGEITVEDAWIKATDTDMTSMFGVLHNPTSEDVTLLEVRVEQAGVVELHTIVEDDSGNMVMTAVEGGFTIEAGGEFLLEPGAEHIMLMDLAEEIAPGMHVEAELVFDNDWTVALEVPAKEFLGAEENYGHDHDE